jgi:type III restriction enzyme
LLVWRKRSTGLRSSSRRYNNCSRSNFSVYDSAWEASEAFELDDNSEIAAWVKNDHLNLEILYVFRGVMRKYRPDFLVRFKSGNLLVLKANGKDTEQDRRKLELLKE